MNPIVAVIPVKDRLGLTAGIVDQLREQGGCAEIIVCDNGSQPGMRKWLGAQDDLTVFDCAGMGIHEMWNRGIERALYAHGEDVCVALLNNDLKLGPEFLSRLRRGLDVDDSLVAVCGNYDGRAAVSDVVYTTEICAARYDGTGGFGSFACMLRGEWLRSSGYRFPEECKWWFGDNDLMLTIRRDGAKAGIVIDAEVEHLGGGGGTAGDVYWTAFREQTQRDQAAFVAKWQRILA
jgi:GT2 family glycosyltransferase